MSIQASQAAIQQAVHEHLLRAGESVQHGTNDLRQVEVQEIVARALKAKVAAVSGPKGKATRSILQHNIARNGGVIVPSVDMAQYRARVRGTIQALAALGQ
ncbi:hypothetical protein SS50377_24160 [Spironucleus salmonicida]|uniref:Uncharacterized protein n=1 Tax=Spironucleus salmonicida TaxID=348837 RepID=A0A9P8LUD3_9EUKA|nr:hypothetical protein SS50377_24160 [Spironucleus salmonicida]